MNVLGEELAHVVSEVAFCNTISASLQCGIRVSSGGPAPVMRCRHLCDERTQVLFSNICNCSIHSTIIAAQRRGQLGSP
jgi:hypothetical protein